MVLVYFQDKRKTAKQFTTFNFFLPVYSDNPKIQLTIVFQKEF